MLPLISSSSQRAKSNDLTWNAESNDDLELKAEKDRPPWMFDQWSGPQEKNDLGLNLDLEIEESIFGNSHKSFGKEEGHLERNKKSTKSMECYAPAVGRSSESSQMNWEGFIQLKELQEENSRVKTILERRNSELKALRQEMTDSISASSIESVISEAHKHGSGLGDEIRDSKIIELAKKARRLNVALERERNSNTTLSTKIKQLESHKRNSNPNGSKQNETLPSGISSPADEKHENKILREKVSQLTRRVEEERNQHQTLRAEVRSLKKLLLFEVGDEIPTSKMLEGGAGWKGRAQQISLLKAKVKELTSRLQQQKTSGEDQALGLEERVESDLTLRDSSDSITYDGKHKESIRRLSAERQLDLDKAKEECEALHAEKKTLKARIDGLQARIQVMDRECKKLKSKIAVLIGKAENDDKLIKALREELTSDKTTGMDKHGEKALAELKRLCSDQTSQLSAQEQTIGDLQQELSHRTGTILDSCKGGASTDVTILRLNSLLSSAEIENEKLRELRVMLDRKLVEAGKQREKLYADLSFERHRADKLNATLSRTKTGQTAKHSLQDENEVERLRVKLAIQQDENKALRLTLESTNESKETELRGMFEVLEQIKSQFRRNLNELEHKTHSTTEESVARRPKAKIVVDPGNH